MLCFVALVDVKGIVAKMLRNLEIVIVLQVSNLSIGKVNNASDPLDIEQSRHDFELGPPPVEATGDFDHMANAMFSEVSVRLIVVAP